MEIIRITIPSWRRRIMSSTKRLIGQQRSLFVNGHFGGSLVAFVEGFLVWSTSDLTSLS